jgi:UDP-N-acetylglucosamine 2-epimerase (non-hydrolysing)
MSHQQMITVDVSSLPDRSVAVVLGTRPEIIKLASILRLLGSKARLVHTGQHYDYTMSDIFFGQLGLRRPDLLLGVGGRGRGAQIGAVLTALEQHFTEYRPRAVVVQGDTNATLAGALAANSREIPLVHVEAGLRSFDRRMPEEHNRVLTDQLADLLCAATPTNVDQLATEGIGGDRALLTGNTVVEAVHLQLPHRETRLAFLQQQGLIEDGYVLATIHRPENTDDPDTLRVILTELGRLPVPVVLPLHPRTAAAISRFNMTSLLANLTVLKPLGSAMFLALAKHAALLISDSGGVQEECTVLKRPLIAVRRSTERPEALRHFAELMEPTTQIGTTAIEWLADRATLLQDLATRPSPYGDGTASARIVAEIVRRYAPDAGSATAANRPPAHAGTGTTLLRAS